MNIVIKILSFLSAAAGFAGTFYFINFHFPFLEQGGLVHLEQGSWIVFLVLFLPAMLQSPPVAGKSGTQITLQSSSGETYHGTIHDQHSYSDDRDYSTNPLTAEEKEERREDKIQAFLTAFFLYNTFIIIAASIVFGTELVSLITFGDFVQALNVLNLSWILNILTPYPVLNWVIVIAVLSIGVITLYSVIFKYKVIKRSVYYFLEGIIAAYLIHVLLSWLLQTF